MSDIDLEIEDDDFNHMLTILVDQVVERLNENNADDMRPTFHVASLNPDGNHVFGRVEAPYLPENHKVASIAMRKIGGIVYDNAGRIIAAWLVAKVIAKGMDSIEFPDGQTAISIVGRTNDGRKNAALIMVDPDQEALENQVTRVLKFEYKTPGSPKVESSYIDQLIQGSEDRYNGLVVEDDPNAEFQVEVADMHINKMEESEIPPEILDKLMHVIGDIMKGKSSVDITKNLN